MIQSLRRTHARAFFVLGFTLPVLLFAAVASRPSLPRAVPVAPAVGLAPTTEQTFPVNDSVLRIRTFRDNGRIALQISPAKALLEPDVLVYASASEPKDFIGSDAAFLGDFAPDKLYRLPAEGARFISLYSLAHQKVVLTVPLEGRQ